MFSGPGCGVLQPTTLCACNATGGEVSFTTIATPLVNLGAVRGLQPAEPPAAIVKLRCPLAIVRNPPLPPRTAHHLFRHRLHHSPPS